MSIVEVWLEDGEEEVEGGVGAARGGAVLDGAVEDKDEEEEEEHQEEEEEEERHAPEQAPRGAAQTSRHAGGREGGQSERERPKQSLCVCTHGWEDTTGLGCLTEAAPSMAG